jgi:two-component system, OmpR family, phosphate regulon sensor histidine kinase PhoR
VKATPTVISIAVVSTVVLSAVGITILVTQRSGWDIASGVLVIIFSLFMLTGMIIGAVALHRSYRDRQLQTDFVSKVNHELRTPLASIRLFVDTLEQGEMDEAERQQCLAAISSETSRLTRLIERLLDWGRMESGRRAYDLRAERVDTLVAEALAQMESQIRESGVEVRLELCEPAPAVLADRNAMVETLLNLLRNAVKYGGAGGVVLVRVRQSAKRALIDVEDRGPGIPRSELRKVFRKFYRGSAARDTSALPGHGLGLAMARHVVKAHRGRVRLDSRPGEGACFTVDLPLIPTEQALEVPEG